MTLEYSIVANKLAESLQALLEREYGLEVPIVVTRHRSDAIPDQTIRVLLASMPNVDGGSDVDEYVELRKLTRPGIDEPLWIRFFFNLHGPSNTIDHWQVEIKGASPDDKVALRNIFDPKPHYSVSTYYWNDRLEPKFRVNGVDVGF